jgi:hypothetical protein
MNTCEKELNEGKTKAGLKKQSEKIHQCSIMINFPGNLKCGIIRCFVLGDAGGRLPTWPNWDSNLATLEEGCCYTMTCTGDCSYNFMYS